MWVDERISGEGHVARITMPKKTLALHSKYITNCIFFGSDQQVCVCVCVCAYVYMCTCMCVCVCVYTCRCGGDVRLPIILSLSLNKSRFHQTDVNIDIRLCTYTKCWFQYMGMCGRNVWTLLAMPWHICHLTRNCLVSDVIMIPGCPDHAHTHAMLSWSLDVLIMHTHMRA